MSPNLELFAGFFIYMGRTQNAILIDHGQGIFTIYMHMSKTLVKAGQSVAKGEIIGLVGNTGLSNGAHLHWGVSIHGTRVNPLEFVKLANGIY